MYRMGPENLANGMERGEGGETCRKVVMRRSAGTYAGGTAAYAR